MLENCQTLQEKWGGVNDIIDRWLEERRQMLVQYCQLSEVGHFDENNPEHGKLLQGLCQIMVDYISAGHFEVYQQLVDESRAFKDSQGVDRGMILIDAIQQTTELALDFNDKYLATDDLQTLTEDLSTLGETLAQRFESEDQMIEVLHSAHRAEL